METADRKGLVSNPTFKVAVISTEMCNEVVGRGVKTQMSRNDLRKINRSNSTKTLFGKCWFTTIIDWNSSNGGIYFICSVLFPYAFDYRTTVSLPFTYHTNLSWLFFSSELQEHVGVFLSEKFWPPNHLSFRFDWFDWLPFLLGLSNAPSDVLTLTEGHTCFL